MPCVTPRLKSYSSCSKQNCLNFIPPKVYLQRTKTLKMRYWSFSIPSGTARLGIPSPENERGRILRSVNWMFSFDFRKGLPMEDVRASGLLLPSPEEITYLETFSQRMTINISRGTVYACEPKKKLCFSGGISARRSPHIDTMDTTYVEIFRFKNITIYLLTVMIT